MIPKIVDAYRKAYSDLPSQIWMLSIALFVNRLGTMVLPFLTLYLTKTQGYTDSSAGYMISIYGVGSVIGAVVGGRLTKPLGAIRLQIVFLSLSVPLFILLPFCTTFVQFSSVLLMLSIACEGVRPANATAITQYSTPGQRTRSFALNRMMLNLGVSVGPVVGGLLITFNFVWIFVADAFTTAACAILLAYFFGFNRKGVSQTESLNEQRAVEAPSPFFDFPFMAYLSLIFITAVVFFQFFTTFPLYLNEFYGLSEFQIGLLFAINTVMVVLFEMLLVDYAKNWNLVLAVGWGSFLSCIGFGILPFSSLIWCAVLSMVVLTVGEMLAAPMSSSWVSHRAERGDTGAYMGYYTMSYSLAFIVGPAVGGIVYERNPALVFYLAIAVAVFVIAGFYALNKTLQREPELGEVDPA